MLRATGSGRTAGTTWTRGRRGAVTAASAAVVVLGGVLAAWGDHSPGGGYVAVGSAGGPGKRSAASTPTGSVSLVPLAGQSRAHGGGTRSNSPAPAPGSSRSTSDSTTPGGPQQPTPSPDTPKPSGGTGDDHGGSGGRTEPPGTPTSPVPAPSHSTAPAPARLSWGDPATGATDRRWCQKVTVALHNSGGTAVRSGSVSFGTHVIGALGIDWGTVTSTADLPVPIAPGARKDPTWTVCVDAWRVPLGMHIETRDVSVEWR